MGTSCFYSLETFNWVHICCYLEAPRGHWIQYAEQAKVQTNNPLACPTSTSNWDIQTLKWEGLALVIRKTFPTVRAGQIPGMNQGGVYKLPFSTNPLKSGYFSSIQGSSTDLTDVIYYTVWGAQSQHPDVHFPSLLFVSNKKVADRKTCFRLGKSSPQLQFLWWFNSD